MLEKWPDEGGLSTDILKAEQEGDRITHDIIQRLNTTFVTPIDREDIHTLATQMDDIVDHIEEVADFMGLYRIEIHRLENDGDRIYRDAVASLFADRIDPMVVIRWRDVFLRLERAIDATETSASVIEGIVIKNA